MIFFHSVQWDININIGSEVILWILKRCSFCSELITGTDDCCWPTDGATPVIFGPTTRTAADDIALESDRFMAFKK